MYTRVLATAFMVTLWVASALPARAQVQLPVLSDTITFSGNTSAFRTNAAGNGTFTFRTPRMVPGDGVVGSCSLTSDGDGGTIEGPFDCRVTVDNPHLVGVNNALTAGHITGTFDITPLGTQLEGQFFLKFDIHLGAAGLDHFDLISGSEVEPGQAATAVDGIPPGLLGSTVAVTPIPNIAGSPTTGFSLSVTLRLYESRSAN